MLSPPDEIQRRQKWRFPLSFLFHISVLYFLTLTREYFKHLSKDVSKWCLCLPVSSWCEAGSPHVTINPRFDSFTSYRVPGTKTRMRSLVNTAWCVLRPLRCPDATVGLLSGPGCNINNACSSLLYVFVEHLLCARCCCISLYLFQTLELLMWINEKARVPAVTVQVNKQPGLLSCSFIVERWDLVFRGFLKRMRKAW